MTPESVSRCSWLRSFETYAMKATPEFFTTARDVLPDFWVQHTAVIETIVTYINYSKHIVPTYINYSNILQSQKQYSMKQPCELGCAKEIDPDHMWFCRFQLHQGTWKALVRRVRIRLASAQLRYLPKITSSITTDLLTSMEGHRIISWHFSRFRNMAAQHAWNAPNLKTSVDRWWTDGLWSTNIAIWCLQ